MSENGQGLNSNTNSLPSTAAFVQLIASLYELSKAANEASKAAVELFNAVDTKPEYTVSTPLFDPAIVSQAAAAVAAPAAVPAEADKKKKKKKRDPNAPKKPLTSFFLYSTYMRDVIIKEKEKAGEQLSQPDIAKETSLRWKALSDEKKAEWKDLYEKEKVVYDVEIKKYNDSKETGATYVKPAPHEVPLAPPSYAKKRSADEKKEKKEKKKKHTA